MPYCLIKNNTIVNLIECSPEYAVENNLEWVDHPIGLGFVLIDGVWRDKPQTQKEYEIKLIALERSRFLEFDYIDNPDVWNRLSQEQKDEILAIKSFCDNVDQQQGFPFDIVFPDRTLIDGEL